MLHNFLKIKSKGQTMVEYSLFIVILISIILFLFGKIKAYILGDQTCTPTSKILVCRVERTMNFGEGSSVPLGQKYRNFSF